MFDTINYNERKVINNSKNLQRERDYESLNIKELSTKFKSVIRTKFDKLFENQIEL